MGDKILGKQIAGMKLVTSPGSVKKRFSFHTKRTSSFVHLTPSPKQPNPKLANSSSTSMLNVKKKGHSWLKFPKRSFIGDRVDLDDLQHQTFIDSLESLEKNKGQKGGYAPNCISIFEDERILPLFSPRKSLKKSAKVIFKANQRNLKDQIVGTLNLIHGKITFDTEEGETVFSANILDMKSLRYTGQQKKVFGFSCFIRGKKNEKTGHSNLVVSRVLIECENPKAAKSWIAALLLEIERVGDTIFLCMENMKSVYKNEKVSDSNFPHTECLLRKRVHLYEVSLLEGSQKLNEARMDICNFLEDKQRFGDASDFSAKIELYFKRRYGKLNKELWQNVYIENIESMDDIEIIKQEIELQAIKCNHGKQDEEGAIISTPDIF
eukprot:snap_masked-scaffold_24-processed-gene-4.24-mRNA-1 protein AED:1.00 eAED:1.00 QI:0/-1/0/0/-1/1/1/0/379